MHRNFLIKFFMLFLIAMYTFGCNILQSSSNRRGATVTCPNIVYILADDMGYGDVSCLNRNSKISTPNLDQIAKEGMLFTDAHSGSAVCTPTRYGILTGRYSWRSRLKEGVTWGDSPHLIEDGRMTVASLLKSQGYHTACIGKWHLGWDWQKKENNSDDIDFTKPILHGPNTNGFDYSFCIPASLDIPPYVYVENDTVTAAPDRIVAGKKGKLLMREGPTGADFKHIEVLPKLTEKAVTYINERGLENNLFSCICRCQLPIHRFYRHRSFRAKAVQMNMAILYYRSTGRLGR